MPIMIQLREPLNPSTPVQLEQLAIIIEDPVESLLLTAVEGVQGCVGLFCLAWALAEEESVD